MWIITALNGRDVDRLTRRRITLRTFGARCKSEELKIREKYDSVNQHFALVGSSLFPQVLRVTDAESRDKRECRLRLDCMSFSSFATRFHRFHRTNWHRRLWQNRGQKPTLRGPELVPEYKRILTQRKRGWIIKRMTENQWAECERCAQGHRSKDDRSSRNNISTPRAYLQDV
jgi:hypothetical protein